MYILSLQEEELRKSGEAKYAHLSNDLHVLIEVFAPPGEAYSRMSHALEEIKKFLVPVSLSLYLIFSSNFYSNTIKEQQSLLLTIISPTRLISFCSVWKIRGFVDTKMKIWMWSLSVLLYTAWPLLQRRNNVFCN